VCMNSYINSVARGRIIFFPGGIRCHTLMPAKILETVSSLSNLLVRMTTKLTFENLDFTGVAVWPRVPPARMCEVCVCVYAFICVV